MRRTLRIPLVAAAALLSTFALSACGGVGAFEAPTVAPEPTPDPPLVEPSPETTAEPELCEYDETLSADHPGCVEPKPEPEQETPEPELAGTCQTTILGYDQWAYHGSLDWSGGLMALWRGGQSPPEVDLFHPGWAEPRTCTLSLLVDGEEADLFAPSHGAASSFAGTSGERPRLIVAYSLIEPSHGLNPQVGRAYVQVLDPETCTLGDRIDVLASMSIEATLSQPRISVITASEDAFVLAVGERPDVTVAGFSIDDGLMLWSHGGLAPSGLRNRFGGPADIPTDAGLILLPNGRLIDIDGTEVATVDMTTPPWSTSVRRLSEDTAFVTGSRGERRSYFVRFGGTPVRLVEQDGCRWSRTWFSRQNDDEIAVLSSRWGWYDNVAVCLLTSDGTQHVVIPSDLASDLRLAVSGAVGGHVFVESDTERIIVDLEGNDAGRWNWAPVGTSPLGSENTTIWQPDFGQLPAHRNNFAITCDGESPE